MDRVLAVVSAAETDVELLEEAGTVAAGLGVEVVVLALAAEGDDHASVEAMRQWNGFNDAGTDGDVDTVHRFARHLGEQVLEPLGVEYLAVGDEVTTTRPSEKVIGVAENHGCDHVYVANRRRSPAGKALFGDTTQSIILNFDGFVTVRTV